MFDEFITDSYRIVNNKDIVPRIPRSSKTNRFLQYEHVGRTVMISEGVEGGDDTQLGSEPALLWVQGESPLTLQLLISWLAVSFTEHICI